MLARSPLSAPSTTAVTPPPAVYAAPLVSGVVALVLEANPSLTWRDVQGPRRDARTNFTDEDDEAGQWTTNAAGVKRPSGFGLVDALAATTAATTWTTWARKDAHDVDDEQRDPARLQRN